MPQNLGAYAGILVWKSFWICNELDNAYINKTHPRQWQWFFPFFQLICYIQKNSSSLISKHLGRKYFFMEQLPGDSFMLLFKQKNSISIIYKILILYLYFPPFLARTSHPLLQSFLEKISPYLPPLMKGEGVWTV